jgi:hypothetical protein
MGPSPSSETVLLESLSSTFAHFWNHEILERHENLGSKIALSPDQVDRTNDKPNYSMTVDGIA